MAVGRLSFPFGRPGLFSTAMLVLWRATGYVEDVYFPGGKCWQIPLLRSQVLNHTTARHRLVTSRARGTINYTHLRKWNPHMFNTKNMYCTWSFPKFDLIIHIYLFTKIWYSKLSRLYIGSAPPLHSARIKNASVSQLNCFPQLDQPPRCWLRAIDVPLLKLLEVLMPRRPYPPCLHGTFSRGLFALNWWRMMIF